MRLVDYHGGGGDDNLRVENYKNYAFREVDDDDDDDLRVVNENCDDLGEVNDDVDNGFRVVNDDDDDGRGFVFLQPGLMNPIRRLYK